VTNAADSPENIESIKTVLLDGLSPAERARVIGGGGSAGEPNVTITLDGGQFLRIATGADDPMRAYFSGRISIAGDIMLAAKLGSLFVVPGR